MHYDDHSTLKYIYSDMCIYPYLPKSVEEWMWWIIGPLTLIPSLWYQENYMYWSTLAFWRRWLRHRSMSAIGASMSTFCPTDSSDSFNCTWILQDYTNTRHSNLTDQRLSSYWVKASSYCNVVVSYYLSYCPYHLSSGCCCHNPSVIGCIGHHCGWQ